MGFRKLYAIGQAGADACNARIGCTGSRRLGYHSWAPHAQFISPSVLVFRLSSLPAYTRVCASRDAISFIFATRKWTTGFLALLSFHLHLLEDLLGSRGPDCDQWPIPYLKPFSSMLQLTWRGQWALNAWPNILITVVLLFCVFWLAWRRGFSPLEMISSKADRAFVETMRRHFPSKIVMPAR